MSKARPNILLLFTDQQRADTIGRLGNAVIRTPNLDRLCTDGVCFTSAYSPSPVCISARCSMLYGQYPHNSGCFNNGYPMPQDERLSFVEALTEAGYRTHGIGKCHFVPDRQALRGFETRERQEELVSSPDQDDYLKFLHDRGFGHIRDPHGIRGEMYYIPQPAQMPAELHPTQWVGDRALAFLESQAASQQPWFLFCSFIHPHPPFSPPNPWHKLYRAPLMPLPNLPQDFESLYTYINRHQNRYKYRDQGTDQNLLRCIKAYYYAAISFIDYQVGRILDLLEKTGQINHTLILFSSDHGELLGDYHCFGKRSMHDACARIPLLARLPGRFAGGQICPEPVSLVDLAPTILSTADCTLRSHNLDGVDLAEVAAGTANRPFVFSQFERQDRAIYMVLNKRWKYFYSAPDQREYLFNRLQDPAETRNRADVPFCGKAQAEMKRTLIDCLRRGGQTGAVDGDDWRLFPLLEMPANPDSDLLIQDAPWADLTIPGYTDF